MPPVPDLRRQASDVLRRNDRGGWTRPSPELYPHQWSWDAAFIAIGWAHLAVDRAISELRHLFAAQWSTGMVPHIVFDPTVVDGAYEPGPAAWATAGHAPDGTATSAICQPPVHALALSRIVAIAGPDHPGLRTAVAELVPHLARWHRWLRTARDPEGTGLVTILHPWESGLDNSPRWDRPLAAVRPDVVGADRPDLHHVADPDQRPTDADYARYRALVAALVEVDHDQARAMAAHPFRVRDVFVSAILAAADDALADLIGLVDPDDAADPDGRAARHRADAERTRAALDGCWDHETARCLDVDAITGASIESDTVAAFAPLIAGTSIDRTARLVDRLWSAHSAGHPDLRWPLPPSTAVDDPAFAPRRYWRGPQWPPITWLLWNGLVRAGHRRGAERLRVAALDQLRVTGCTEYVDPITGDPLGSDAQSWTAAVALDWLAPEQPPPSADHPPGIASRP